MSFRDNLRFIMESKDIQTKELSKLSGISENTLKSYLKSDSAEPKISKAARLADALNVSIDFLVTGKSKRDEVATKVLSLIDCLRNMSLSDIKLVEDFINSNHKK